ncbi:MAG: hypothetical protein ACOC5K_04745 [Chloroflexota bacterium]
MSDIAVAIVPFIGIGAIIAGNVMRAQRTQNNGRLGHFFIKAEEMTMAEWTLNRAGIAVFGAGLVLNVVL